MKQCSICKIAFSLENYHTDKKTKDGKPRSCKSCSIERAKIYYLANKESCNKRSGDWRKTHINPTPRKKKKTWAGINSYIQNRKKQDPVFYLSFLIRDRFIKAIRGKSKKGSAVRDLGMNVKDFLVYLNLDCLDKYGEPYTGNEFQYHIDHIRPLSAFDLSDQTQMLIACNWRNLQILTIKENLSKGFKMETQYAR